MLVFGVALPVDQKPQETITYWSVREVMLGQTLRKSRHLIGYIQQKGVGRVISATQEFDCNSMINRTSSGACLFIKKPTALMLVRSMYGN